MQCYDEFRPLVPTAETYHWLINGGYVDDSDDPNDETNTFNIGYFEIEVNYPDHSIVNGTLTKYKIVEQIGICR